MAAPGTRVQTHNLADANCADSSCAPAGVRDTNYAEDFTTSPRAGNAVASVWENAVSK